MHAEGGATRFPLQPPLFIRRFGLHSPRRRSEINPLLLAFDFALGGTRTRGREGPQSNLIKRKGNRKKKEKSKKRATRDSERSENNVDNLFGCYIPPYLIKSLFAPSRTSNPYFISRRLGDVTWNWNAIERLPGGGQSFGSSFAWVA